MLKISKLKFHEKKRKKKKLNQTWEILLWYLWIWYPVPTMTRIVNFNFFDLNILLYSWRNGGAKNT